MTLSTRLEALTDVGGVFTSNTVDEDVGDQKSLIAVLHIQIINDSQYVLCLNCIWVAVETSIDTPRLHAMQNRPATRNVGMAKRRMFPDIRSLRVF